jgi:hypothetical protein
MAPCLRALYDALTNEPAVFRRRLLLSTLVLLTTESAFGDATQRMVCVCAGVVADVSQMLPFVPWFATHELRDISVGR